MRINKYTQKFVIRLAPEEKVKLFKDAKKSGISASSYIRSLINNQSPAVRDDIIDIITLKQEIRNLKYEINKIGINLKQVTTRFNSNYFSESEKKKIYGYMTELSKNIEKLNKLEDKY